MYPLLHIPQKPLGIKPTSILNLTRIFSRILALILLKEFLSRKVRVDGDALFRIMPVEKLKTRDSEARKKFILLAAKVLN